MVLLFNFVLWGSQEGCASEAEPITPTYFGGFMLVPTKPPLLKETKQTNKKHLTRIPFLRLTESWQH